MMTIPVRERILDHIMAQCLAIGPTAAVITARNKTGATAAVSGAFTGTVFSLYRVYVTAAGASGAAEIEIRDMLTETNLFEGQAVTSGAAFDLADGLQMTLTWSGNLLEGDCWFVRSGPGSEKPINDFVNAVKYVCRSPMPVETVPTTPAIIIYETGEDRNQAHYTEECKMFLVIDLWTQGETKSIDGQRWEDRAQAINTLLMDVEQALKGDVQHNQIAENTTIESVDMVLPPTGQLGGAQLTVTISYSFQYDDPATPA